MKKVEKTSNVARHVASLLATLLAVFVVNGPRSLTVRGHVAGHVSGHVRRSVVMFWPRL